MEPRTLAELTNHDIEIAFADAVAIAQQLICEPDSLQDAQPPYEALTLESITVTADGMVRCLRKGSTPTVTEVGLVLQSLLRNSPSLPGGLRYTVSRAIHEVEAPPFESVEDLSRALERFEAGDRREQVASLYQRASAAIESNADLGSAAPESGTPDNPERRTRQQSAASLRRQLRDADQRFYEAQLHASQALGPVERGRARRVPIAACMIAGVALVAAGEMAHVGPPARAMDASQPLPPPSGVATAPADAISESAVATVPINASEKLPRPAVTRREMGRTNTRANALTTQGRTTTTTTTKATSSRPSNASTQSSRKAVESRLKDDHSKPKSKPDKPDHGLLRIRFVWNNPFH